MANVDGDLAAAVSNGVAIVALHVIRGLIEVPNARDVVFAMLTDDVTVVSYDNGSVPYSASVPLVALQMKSPAPYCGLR